jgi:hypothetical protein
MKERAGRLAVEVFTDFLLLTSFAFGPGQRKAIIERDKEVGIKVEGNKGGCQWPYRHNCNGDKRINVHHGYPEMYQRRVGILNPDTPDIAVSLCTNIHTGDEGKKQHGPHPDQPGYLEEYRKGNKRAFEKMQQDRKDKLDERIPYWDTTHERELVMLARRNTQRMNKKKPGWWPFQ